MSVSFASLMSTCLSPIAQPLMRRIPRTRKYLHREGCNKAHCWWSPLHSKSTKLLWWGKRLPLQRTINFIQFINQTVWSAHAPCFHLTKQLTAAKWLKMLSEEALSGAQPFKPQSSSSQKYMLTSIYLKCLQQKMLKHSQKNDAQWMKQNSKNLYDGSYLIFKGMITQKKLLQFNMTQTSFISIRVELSSWLNSWVDGIS